MMKVRKFAIAAPDSSDEMSGEAVVSIGNPAGEDVRWIQYRAVFEDARGFPLACTEGTEDCRLEPNEAIDVSAHCSLHVKAAGPRRDDVVVRVAATLHAREFVRLGEIDVPAAELGHVSIAKSVQSAVLDADVKVLAVRVRNDEEGQGRVECRVAIRNRSGIHLDRVELKCELLDADEAVVETGEDSVSVAAGCIACIDGGAPWVKAAQLKRAKLRLSLGVFRPVHVGLCVGTSVPEDGDSDDQIDSDEVELDEGIEDGDGQDDGAEELEDGGEDLEDDGDEGDAVDDGESDEDDDEEGESPEDDPLADLDPGVAAVLEAAGATAHAGDFLDNQITDDVLASITDADLVEMGIAALGLRKRIIAEIASLGRRGGQPSRPKPVPGRTPAPSGQLPPAPRRVTNWAAVLKALGSSFAAIDRVVVGPAPDNRKLVGALEYISPVHRGLKPLLVYDDTFFGSGKDGLLVSEFGVHWRNSYKEPGFAPWASLHAASAKGKAVVLEPGGEVSCAYAGAKCAQALAVFINCAAGAAMASMADDSHPQRDELRDAILEMRGIDEDGYVIAEDPVSGWFVQFCNGDDGPVLDIPHVSHTDLEQERAAGFLDQCGFSTTEDDDSESHQREYGEDAVEELLSDAIRALQGIYRLRPGTPLTITKGWE